MCLTRRSVINDEPFVYDTFRLGVQNIVRVKQEGVHDTFLKTHNGCYWLLIAIIDYSYISQVFYSYRMFIDLSFLPPSVSIPKRNLEKNKPIIKNVTIFSPSWLRYWFLAVRLSLLNTGLFQ